MKFFTDKTVENDYLLIKIYDYLKKDFDWNKWKEIFIDPGVYELKKQVSYSWENQINIGKFLNQLPANHYFSVDYPCDMNLKHTDLFLKKSWNNALRYNNNKNYIVTVQSKFNDYLSFKKWFDKYNEIDIVSGILGLGNICRIHQLTEYVKHSLGYAFKNCNHQRIHIYGLAFKCIPYANKLSKKFEIELSVDSTKWTRACSTELRNKYYPKTNCTSSNREEFFQEYIKKIKEKGVILENEFTK